jgi:hypothetical protein
LATNTAAFPNKVTLLGNTAAMIHSYAERLDNPARTLPNVVATSHILVSELDNRATNLTIRPTKRARLIGEPLCLLISQQPPCSYIDLLPAKIERLLQAAKLIKKDQFSLEMLAVICWQDEVSIRCDHAFSRFLDGRCDHISLS